MLSGMNMTVFWDHAKCSLVETDRFSEVLTASIAPMMETPLKRRQICTRLHGATYHKTVIFILAAVRT
jgi:hypothetical protein